MMRSVVFDGTGMGALPLQKKKTAGCGHRAGFFGEGSVAGNRRADQRE